MCGVEGSLLCSDMLSSKHPHVKTEPSEDRAAVWQSPHATSIIFLPARAPSTRVGTVFEVWSET